MKQVDKIQQHVMTNHQLPLSKQENSRERTKLSIRFADRPLSSNFLGHAENFESYFGVTIAKV